MRFARDHEDDDPTVEEMTDDEFFDWIAAGLERKRERLSMTEQDKPATKPATPGQLAFTYAIAWLLGSGVLLALACGVIALVKLLFGLTT